MRVVIQRVLKASVTVDDHVVSSINRGLCVLVGLSREDTQEDMEYIARKILNLRMFSNAEGDKRWDKSVKDLGLEVLCVSQFTLYGILKGNKIDFHHAMQADKSADAYQSLIKRLGQMYSPDKIKDGVFGAKMIVNIENDGPVTMTLDSPSKAKTSEETGCGAKG